QRRTRRIVRSSVSRHASNVLSVTDSGEARHYPTSRSIDTAGTPSLTLTVRSTPTPPRGSRAFPRGLIRLPERPDDGQENLPAEHASAQADPWFSRADEHEKWPAGPEAPAGPGTQASHREQRIASEG